MSGTELEIPATGLIEDALPPEQTEPIARNPREEALARIAAHYEEQLASELALGDEMARDADARAPAAEGGDSASLPSHAPQSSPDAPAHAVAPQQAQHQQPPPLRAINVQGQQLLVTEEQYDRLASIGAVANLALEQQHRQQTQVPPPPVPAPMPSGAHLDRERAADIVQRLTYGSPEDGTAALEELIAATRVDPHAIAAHAAQQTLAHIQLQQDLNAIGQEFPEIFSSQDRSTF